MKPIWYDEQRRFGGSSPSRRVSNDCLSGDNVVNQEEDQNMSNAAAQDRAAGAIMGAFIGDALGLGPHWYYDLAALRRDYGD